MAVDGDALAIEWALGDFMTDRASFHLRAGGVVQATPVKANLPCRVSMVERSNMAGAQRAELAALRTMFWIENYTPPLDCVVRLNGEARNWNIRIETLHHNHDKDRDLDYWECDLSGASR